MWKTTVFESELLLLVPAIHNRPDQVISFLPLYHIVQDLSIVAPHEISNGQIASPHFNSVLFSQFLLKKTLLDFILHLSHIYQHLYLDFLLKSHKSFLNLPFIPEIYRRDSFWLLFWQKCIQNAFDSHRRLLLFGLNTQNFHLFVSLWSQFDEI